MDKDTRRCQSQALHDLNDEIFNQYLESEVKGNEKFEKINQTVEYLKLPLINEHLIKYKEIILDKWKVSDHDAVIRFLKSADYINNKMTDLEFKGIDVKNLTNRYHKLKIIREMEAEFGINSWTPQAPTKTEMKDEFYRLVRTVFRTKLAKPTTSKEIVAFYGALVKSATCRNFINIKKGEITINTDFVTEHLELNAFKNEKRTGFSIEAKKHFGIETNEVPYLDGAELGLEDGL